MDLLSSDWLGCKRWKIRVRCPFDAIRNKSNRQPATGRPFSIRSLSHANYVVRLPPNIADAPGSLEEVLSESFMTLLDLAIQAIRHDENHPSGSPSYNVILTLGHLHLIPRRQESYILRDTNELLSVNSLGFAGMLLVKSTEELDAVRNEGIRTILRGVGVGHVEGGDSVLVEQ